MTEYDFKIRREGSLFLVATGTPAGSTWLEENVDTDNATWWLDELVVEHRFIHPLVQGMLDAGMKVV